MPLLENPRGTNLIQNQRLPALSLLKVLSLSNGSKGRLIAL